MPIASLEFSVEAFSGKPMAPESALGQRTVSLFGRDQPLELRRNHGNS
jgi:hypothetical protein